MTRDIVGPTLIVVGGRIHTLDPRQPVVEALAVTGNLITTVGTRSEVMAKRTPTTRVLDIGGMSATPGFHDAHLHFVWFGLGLAHIDLAEVVTVEEALQRIETKALTLPPTSWVLGGGWNHDLWSGRLPTSGDLDRATGGRPALLRRKDGHSAWVNHKALELAGIHAATPDPPGGRIHRDASGEPTGILAEHAMDLIGDLVPRPTSEQQERAIDDATSVAHRLGVTSVHNMEGADVLHLLIMSHEAAALRLRITMQLSVDGFEAALADGVRTGDGDELLRIGALKIFSDGALGSRTAAMLEPYDGEPENAGMLLLDASELIHLVGRAARHGISSAIHAIGDRANRVVLDAFEATRDEWQTRGLRQRIEHVQILHESDVPRLARMGVIASMQPLHATQDMLAADRFWGDRSRLSYAWRSLLNSRTALAFGSDCPVETMDPLAGIYAAVSRRRADGTPPGGWYPEQRLTVAEAVHAYTAGAAYAAGVEDRVGRLSPGMLADIVVLTEDLYVPPADRILRAKVACTILDGDVVYHDPRYLRS